MNAIAIDLGASGGKAFAGRFDGRQLKVDEIYRFPNNPVRVSGHLHWDILRLLHELKQAIGAAAHADLGQITSIGIDAWGVDFGLVDSHGELMGNPYHYRDEQTRGVMEVVLEIVPREEIFACTGIQFMPLNTLYQLYAIKQRNPSLLGRAEMLLMIPDLLRFFLTRERSSEYTNASTTQFLSIASGGWDLGLLQRLDLPTRLLTEIVPPATQAGRLLPSVAAEIGTREIPLTTVASHDTASAVAAVPAEGEFAYLSCGTWSLLGTEVSHPIVNERTLGWNFTNEGGIGAYRLLKNIIGLWLVEGCRRRWERDGIWPGYEAMAIEAAETPPFRSLIDADDPRFLNPFDMPGEIVASCRKSGQIVPETPASIMRCVLESLALTYRLVLERTEQLTGRHFAGLHVVGGGTRNAILMQFTANAIGRPVWSGPAEATAVGNLLAQLIAARRIASVAEGRQLVRESFPLATFEPQQTGAWDAAYDRFLAVRSS